MSCSGWIVALSIVFHRSCNFYMHWYWLLPSDTSFYPNTPLCFSSCHWHSLVLFPLDGHYKGCCCRHCIHVCVDIGHVFLGHSLQTSSRVILNGAFTSRNSSVEFEPLMVGVSFTKDHKNFLSLEPYGFEFYNCEFGKSKGHRNKSQQGMWSDAVHSASLWGGWSSWTPQVPSGFSQELSSAYRLKLLTLTSWITAM